MTNLSDHETAIVRRYLASINPLELAVPASSGNLDTDEAANWSHNKTEVQDRLILLDEWRKRLCGFLGVPPGPYLNRGTLAFTV